MIRVGHKQLTKYLCLSVFFINYFFYKAQNASVNSLKDSLHTVTHRLYEPMRDESILFAKKYSVFVDFGAIFRSIILIGIERKWNNHLAGNIQLGYYRDDPYNFQNFNFRSNSKEKQALISEVYGLSKSKNGITGFASALEMKYKFKASNTSSFIKLGYRFTTNTKVFSNTYRYLRNNRLVDAGLPLDYRIFTNAFYLSFGKEIVIASQSAKFEPSLGIGYFSTLLNGNFTTVYDDLEQRIAQGKGTVQSTCLCKFGVQTPIYTEESKGQSLHYNRLFIQMTFKFHFYYGEK